MKRILMIAPDSYPVKGAESIVNIKLLRALTGKGEFQVDLISKLDSWEKYPSDSLDDLGLKLHGYYPIKVENKINVKTIWQHICAFLRFGVVFKGIHWALSALDLSLQLCKENGYDYVLTKNRMAPFVGYYLKRHKHLKWIATWNDPTPAEMYPYPYGQGLSTRRTWMMRRYFRIMETYPDVHIFPNARLRDYMSKYLSIEGKTKVIAPHVALLEDIQGAACPGGDKLRIIHSGNLNPPRNPDTFLKALARLVSEGVKDIEVSILGAAGKDLNQAIESCNLKEFVRYIPPVTYQKSLDILSDYHVALIIEADCPEGIFLPTKVSDFMQRGKAIMALSPAVGVLNDLYNEGYVRYFAPVNDACAIYDELRRIYQDYKNGLLSKYKPEIPKTYSGDYISELYDSF